MRMVRLDGAAPRTGTPVPHAKYRIVGKTGCLGRGTLAHLCIADRTTLRHLYRYNTSGALFVVRFLDGFLAFDTGGPEPLAAAFRFGQVVHFDDVGVVDDSFEDQLRDTVAGLDCSSDH